MQRVIDIVASAARQIQATQIGVNLFVIWHGRHDAVFQNFHRNHIFDADAHRMPGETFGVCHNHITRRVAKGFAQRQNFSRSRTAARGRECFMRHEYGLRRHRITIQSKASFRRADEMIHHHCNMIHIQPRAVKRAVDGFAAEQFHNAAHTAFAHRILTFDDERARAHAQNCAVSSFVEGQRGFFHAVIRRCRARCQKARANPFHQIVVGHIVRANHNHAAAAPVTNPIFRERDALRR